MGFIQSSEHRGEIASRYNPGGAITTESEMPALVTRYQVIGFSSLAERQAKIISGIGGSADSRQRPYNFCKRLDVVNKAASLIGLDARSDRRLAQRIPQFIELLGACQQGETPFAPRAINRSRMPGVDQQS
jgi:hypothetical protein